MCVCVSALLRAKQIYCLRQKRQVLKIRANFVVDVAVDAQRNNISEVQ